jgi:hypothetical protein
MEHHPEDESNAKFGSSPVTIAFVNIDICQCNWLTGASFNAATDFTRSLLALVLMHYSV